ncbi:hypothetical protein GWK47_041153 [Chionoecetes opilio]|uniref:Uncharacterized protein n=1 Tax=Chionoecetes opilio TaxID=41210 RepID=A0A8J5CXC0_CHIOP|nr:hypothetical protein GWK47_041153 [Chionoecetes opilio]
MYWESLREKLEQLEVEVNDDKCLATETTKMFSLESHERGERSVTGSSDAPGFKEVRFVSGQRCSQESKSDGLSSSDGVAESPDDSAPVESVSSTCTPSNFGEKNVTDKFTKGRRTPPGSCVDITDELEGSTGSPTELSGFGAAEDGESFKVSESKEMSVQFVKNHIAHATCSDASEIRITEGCKMVTDELKIIELEDVEGVYEGNLYDGNAKEEGDGSSSPPPTPCKPSRSLTVIVEELEHCALPE